MQPGNCVLNAPQPKSHPARSCRPCATPACHLCPFTDLGAATLKKVTFQTNCDASRAPCQLRPFFTCAGTQLGERAAPTGDVNITIAVPRRSMSGALHSVAEADTFQNAFAHASPDSRRAPAPEYLRHFHPQYVVQEVCAQRGHCSSPRAVAVTLAANCSGLESRIHMVAMKFLAHERCLLMCGAMWNAGAASSLVHPHRPARQPSRAPSLQRRQGTASASACHGRGQRMCRQATTVRH